MNVIINAAVVQETPTQIENPDYIKGFQRAFEVGKQTIEASLQRRATEPQRLAEIKLQF